MQRTYPTDHGFLTIDSPLDDLDAAAEDQHDFLVNHWTELAAAAYQGFRKVGLGVIVIADEDRGDVEDRPFSTMRVRFAPHGNPWLIHALPKDLHGWLEDQFQSYDTDTSALFVFTGPGDQVRGYCAEGSPPPPDAYKQARAHLN